MLHVADFGTCQIATCQNGHSLSDWQLISCMGGNMINIPKSFATVVLSASILCATPGFSAGIGGVAALNGHNVATDNLATTVKHKRHRRRDLKPGEVIAGAILLGILGAAAASSSGSHYNGQYTTAHENRVKVATKACQRSARSWFRKRFPNRPRVNTLHVTYNGKNRYRVDGVVSNRNNRNKHRFHCNTRNGNVRNFSAN